MDETNPPVFTGESCSDRAFDFLAFGSSASLFLRVNPELISEFFANSYSSPFTDPDVGERNIDNSLLPF